MKLIVTEKDNMPFEVKDCALVSRMAGLNTAINLRELRDRLERCPIESIFHHLCETVVRPTFDDPEFRNDFAVWAAHQLGDRVLAERFGIINPYTFESFEAIREHMIEIIEDRLAELDYTPTAPRGADFRFMRAVTVIFDTRVKLETPHDLIENLPNFSLSSIYYHYVEARRRTPMRTDDFTAWLSDFGNGTEELRQALGDIDFYFLSLAQLRDQLIEAAAPYTEEAHAENA